MDVGGAVEIVVAEPSDHGMRQQDAGLGLAVRGMGHREIGRGIDQHLAGELRAIAVARGERDDGGEIAAGAVAADRSGARRRCRARLRVGRDPFRRGDGVVDGGGEFVLGREAIVDRDHDQLALIGELAADDVVGVEIADHPAAAMEEHQAGARPFVLPQLLRHIDARRDRAVRRGDRRAA